MKAAKITIPKARSMVLIASPVTPPSANGFSTGPEPFAGLSSARGTIAPPAANKTHAKNLQRRDGSLPVGNSSRTKGTSVSSVGLREHQEGEAHTQAEPYPPVRVLRTA